MSREDAPEFRDCDCCYVCCSYYPRACYCTRYEFEFRGHEAMYKRCNSFAKFVITEEKKDA